MNALEHQLEYPFADRLPDGADPVEVGPGVYWLRMPLPFALDHINLWLLEDEIDRVLGWTVVDCGAATAETTQRWERLFDSVLDGLPILRVLVTHCHPDHIGLAHWLCSGGDKRRWRAPLWISFGEYTLGRLLSSGAVVNVGGETVSNHFRVNGLLDDVALEGVKNRENYYRRLVPDVPGQYRRIMEGDELMIGERKWRVVTGFGHSPEHCALYCKEDGLLISGDMVLPRISTNISVFDLEPDGNPLELYLSSLAAYAAMSEDTLVLPSHGRPFTGLRTRIQQLRDHHAERLAEVMALCSQQPSSAADIVPVMFKRKLDMHQMTFAMGEALAHLHLLWNRGSLTRIVDAAGILKFKSR
ncbi:MBL fold metallo-hydrolase [Paraburkholderia phymatum]|uniref:Beta-lactamase domain protein n=1 Tax=Paraburkholderia phymatum (strain DSM 17167 / CIP 108236 / LMG 21445 / STM815) TaxID=391038 RepID=B2JS09_PARP8|nr:MBL fold metallo-hydrolase [Paraburkholderia phymatum]ACC73928.1 beta-lactamase domain protein [Paraburkholderia phymatum STM815]